MLREQIIMSLKTTIGVVFAILIAKALKMEFYSSVATIVVVSMLSDKKQSIKLAATRLLAAIVSLGISSLLFTIFGFSLGVFGLYILIFTFLMYKFNTEIAIVLNIVLVMHIYSLEEISLPILLNEFGLMFLGILVALVINFFILDIEKELIEYQKQTENLFDSIFKNMGKCLINEHQAELMVGQLVELDEILSKGKARAYKYMNSYYIQQNNYYVEYFIMRKQQYYTVRTMQKFIKLKFLKQKEVELLKNFTENIVNNTKILNACESQMIILEEIKHHFTHVAELPPTHDQLQNRIALHQYLYSLEDLVSVKMRFVKEYEKNK
ncbi:MAG: aromatic acid exporter family protein [Tissierellia bacterium]|nr:aromatic acid exporter family protein [Tissierellia bacterium]